MRAWQITRLATQDLWHDRLVTLCMIATLVAVIAPLLLLFGLKHGVVSAMQNELLKDPRNLEIRMLSSGSYDQAWIDELARRPDAGFVIGMTRSLNTQADFIHTAAKFLENVEVLPTAAGDPLLEGVQTDTHADAQADVQADAQGALRGAAQAAALPERGVVFSAQAAQRLDVKAGDKLRMRIARRLNGMDQQAVTELTVLAVLPGRAYERAAAFVQPALLRDMEWYRDGYAVASMGAVDGQPSAEARVRFARARVYARDLDAVEALDKSLIGRGIETGSRLADIRNVKAINQLLTTVFNVIAITAITGCVAALAGAFLANVRRKRRDIATLRLLGVSGREITVFLASQAAALTAVAMVLGLGIYFMGSAAFDQLFGGVRASGQFTCHITPLHGSLAFMVALGVALLASVIGAASAKRIQPAESLREI
ncbi:ABC transporter permease [Bordetella sp. LUAb4]|uniref:ABC transporter permease n=1 Tax=Bordetella sp. LUAb4 TaxID=2843195 RepID=UPI001E4D9859|nr:FtsX-like permease family protein [Bordetella sp. LUAb4]